MARLAKYKVWIAVAIALIVIGVVVSGFVGCQSTSTGTSTTFP